MIELLQILGVIVTGMLTLMFSLLIVGPALGGIFHGKRFKIEIGHTLLAGVALSLCLFQLWAYGWWTP